MTNKLSKPLFLVLAVACMVLRFWLKLTAVDPDSGFYEGGGMLVPILYALLGGGILLLFLLQLVGRGKPAAPRAAVFNPVVNGLAALTGMALLAYAATRLLNFLGGNAFSGAQMTQLMLFGAFALVFLLAFPAISGFLLIFTGMRGHGQDSMRFRTNGWLALSPLLWLVADLLMLFMSYTAIRFVSDQMLTIVTMIVMAPFLLAHGRLIGGVDHDKGVRQLGLFGLPFALLALTVSSGLLAAAFTGKSVALAMPLSGAVFLFFAGLYAAALCFSVREVTPPVFESTLSPEPEGE